MESVRRNVRDLNREERLVYECALGRELAEDQQVIIQVVTLESGLQLPQNDSWSSAVDSLPEWCSVYAGLNDTEIGEVEKIILYRSNMSRPAE